MKNEESRLEELIIEILLEICIKRKPIIVLFCN